MIYSTDTYEPRKHIHVTYNYRGFKRSCKFWMEPEIIIDENKRSDFTDRELNEIEILIYENKEILINQLNLFYNRYPVKAIRK